MSASSIRLGELFEQAGLAPPTPEVAGLSVSSVADDSRRVEPGALFVATRGVSVDGHRFIADAVERGAAAVVAEEGAEMSVPAGGAMVPVIKVADSRDALGRLAHAFRGNPSREMLVIGVTGTNGKTTTTFMLESVLRAAERNPGVIGTIEYRYANRAIPAPNTTPSAVQLAELFAEMRAAGVDAVAIELSSHAADQRRISGIQFDTVIFTNLTQDHLDYHGTMESYAEAKRSIFTDYLLRSKKAGKHPAAVFNADDAWGAAFARDFAPLAPMLRFGIETPDADIRATNIRTSASGTEFGVLGPGERQEQCRLKLIGRFNVLNALGVWAGCLVSGIGQETVQRGLAEVCPNFGRFEQVDEGQDFIVIVDYAHTPDALENVLRNARPMTEGRLICVFGCGGDRDNKKRPLMGEIAARLADHVVLTNDNPRTEDPVRITDMVLEGVRKTPIASSALDVIHDRREAIGRAISLASAGDLVLIAGKGHENYQIVGTEKIHFDDRETAREFLRARLGVAAV